MSEMIRKYLEALFDSHAYFIVLIHYTRTHPSGQILILHQLQTTTERGKNAIALIITELPISRYTRGKY